MEGTTFQEGDQISGTESGKETSFQKYTFIRLPDPELQTNLFDDDAPKWKNHALSLFASETGQDVFHRRMDDQFSVCILLALLLFNMSDFFNMDLLQ